jgi:hypothetical protein
MRYQLLSRLSVSVTLLSSLTLMGCGGGPGVDDPLAIGSVGSELSKKDALTLKSKQKAIFWSGTATNAPPINGQPAVCAQWGARCQVFDLNIDLPNNVWKKPGGVQVAIRWPNDTNALELYVYKNGVQVGLSEGFLATISQLVLLPSAANGTYQVYVVLDTIDSLDPSVPFDAEARVQEDIEVKPIRKLLPDFAMRPQTTVTFDTPEFPFFGDHAKPGESCYDGEKAENPGTEVCMRFEQTFANVGEGPAELRFPVAITNPPLTGTAFSRTYSSDGSHVDAPAGTWEFHEAHHHYHYDNFVQSNLWAADSKGRRLGSAPIRAGRKVSFCMEDEGIDSTMWGQEGVRPRAHQAPDCLFFVEQDANFNYIIQGLSPGWIDIYQWYLPGQYIEVSGVADGTYVLETIADPDNELVEPDESNNCGTVLVRLTHMSSPPRHAEIIGAGPGCKKK